jgi:hypothetical protein
MEVLGVNPLRTKKLKGAAARTEATDVKKVKLRKK